MPFDNTTVLLTGVGREGQVGEVVAAAFAERGATVLLVDRESSAVEARAGALRNAGHRAVAMAADLTHASDVAAIGERIRADYAGRLDALVNMAGGYARSGPVAESDIAIWDKQFAINLTTAYLVTRAFLPFVRSARGSIVFFASDAVLPGSPVAGVSAYAAAKSALVSLMRSVAEEERMHGVRANAVAPSAIRTASNVEAMGDGVRYVERETVAAAVLFLCSSAATGVSGQLLHLSS